MWYYTLSTGVFFPLFLWIAAFVRTIDSIGIDSIETGLMGFESSDVDATTSNISFDTIDRGQNSGIKEALTEVYRTQGEFTAFWEQHVSDGGHNHDPPPLDFTTKMVAVVFMGTQVTGGFSVEVTSVEEKEGDGLEVKFTTTVPLANAMVTQALTQPYDVVSVDATDNGVTFEGTQAANVPSPLIPMYIVSFKEAADFGARVAQLQNDPRVNKVQVMNSLRMVFVSFDSENIDADDALDFLYGLEGVQSIEEDQ